MMPINVYFIHSRSFGRTNLEEFCMFLIFVHHNLHGQSLNINLR
jgi:hypothetical protein